jgi:hypothetical protein
LACCRPSSARLGQSTERPHGGVNLFTAIRLVAKGVDPKLLDEAVQGARRVTSGGGFVDWRAGENALRSSTGGVKQGFPPRPKQPGTRGYRHVDAFDEATGIAREAKTGFAKLTPFVQRQIDKDVASLAQGGVNGLEWHFYPSSASDTLGPSRQLLDELRHAASATSLHLP